MAEDVDSFIPVEASRCGWAGSDPLYVRYHDAEWGRPVDDDTRLFEKLCLEGFQSGLSWLTILKKREHFRAAFAGFDIGTVAAMDDGDVARLLADPGIVRHRGKIVSTMNNARRVSDVQAEFGSFAAYIWGLEPSAAERPEFITRDVLGTLSQTPASAALSADLRRRGFTFVGPTTAYAFMQAMGLVNDHEHTCAVRAEVERQRTAFIRPRPRLAP